MSSELNSVQKFYKDKTVFITGGSGFMGKVLIEKLLYSCSDVKELIVLMREKRGKSASQRIEALAKLPIFTRIKEDRPEVMKKITIVVGEIAEPNLGLNEENLRYVIERTEIIFHLAASVKLEAPLRPNVLANLTATKQVIEIAKEMKNLILLMHTSTAFCNMDQKIVDEVVYDFPQNPNDLIRCAEWMNEAAMSAFQKDALLYHPNTYTYTKRLAEILVRDEYNQSNLPLCIVRPSIVTPSFWEPVIGWCDSMNGPPGIGIAAGKGVLRTLLIDMSCKFEAIPVDMAVNGLIMFAKKIGTSTTRPKEIPIANLTVHETSKVTYEYMFKEGEYLRYEAPFSQVLWYPNLQMTQSKIYYAINVFLFQWIPAYFIDFWLWVFRQPRFMIKVQQKIAIGMDVLKFFTMNHWQFKSSNYDSLVAIQDREEWEMFLVDGRNVGNNDKYMRDSFYGVRQYCAKDPLSTIPKSKIIMKILYVIDLLFKLAFVYWIGRKILVVSGLIVPIQAFITQFGGRFTIK